MYTAKNGKEEFFSKDIFNLVSIIGDIYSASKKFMTDKNIWLLRGISDYDILRKNMGDVNRFDAFLSTTRTPNLFNYKMEGVSYSDFVQICVPKGCSFIPMDIVSERQ